MGLTITSRNLSGNIRASCKDPHRDPSHKILGSRISQGGQTGVFKAGGLTIDYDKHRVFIDGVEQGLTQNEYKIVESSWKVCRKVMTYDYIIKEIWGTEHEER